MLYLLLYISSFYINVAESEAFVLCVVYKLSYNYEINTF